MPGNWWKSTFVYSAICFPAKWIHVFLSLGWKAMPLIKVFNISARLCTLQAMCIGGLLMSLVPYMNRSTIGALFSEALLGHVGELFTEVVALVQIIGLWTSSMRMNWKVTLDTKPEPPCHVLIWTPLVECLMIEYLTVWSLKYKPEIYLYQDCQCCTGRRISQKKGVVTDFLPPN